MKLLAGVILALAPQAGLAQDLGNMRCDGPNWVLELWPPNARFSYPSAVDMEFKHEAIAQGESWPRAYTLIGDRDTGILILEAAGADQSRRALFLTQRAGQPILLDGTCHEAGRDD